MQSFIHRKNLELFRKKLLETCDEHERRAVERLLAEEEAKDAPPAKKSDAN